MTVPAGSAVAEHSVKASRFISQTWLVHDRREVDACLEQVRVQHPHATHRVYAFVIGPQQHELLGQSDDGEPHGTAGRPVLEILRGSGLRNCLVTVLRYFGGTRLGTGGLVRAYGDAAREVLALTPVSEYRQLTEAMLNVPYSLHEQIRRLLLTAAVEIRSEHFSETVLLELGVPAGELNELEEAIRDVSRGTLGLELNESAD